MPSSSLETTLVGSSESTKLKNSLNSNSSPSSVPVNSTSSYMVLTLKKSAADANDANNKGANMADDFIIGL
ncbi:hypothetical protein Cantr_07189 [Candida viswanathii]|uniref:Uncharacterized protein n=1 Tax=Candida viswanathii TaxID=5486 RepID=A0A367XYR7_9ASCO|nr:hypothetical protein Cantr_07189 [Candida viswanathii]